MFPFELAQCCKDCIKKHKKKKGEFLVGCNGIPKEVMEGDTPYYPVEKLLGESVYNSLPESTKLDLHTRYNKLLWAKEYLGWSTFNKKRNFDQWYQKQMLMCSAPQKVFRCGRRMGKSEGMVLDIIHYAAHNPGMKVALIGPFQILVDELFQRIDDIMGSEVSAFKGKYSRTRKPNKIIFENGAVITGYTTGRTGTSIRGQSADRIYLDEAAYFPEEIFKAVLALKLESENVELIAASTPSAIETNFKKWCMTDPTWAEFHFKSNLLPSFEKDEQLFRTTLTKEAYQLEVEAEFNEGNSRVFKSIDVEESIEEYNYINNKDELKNPNDWIITLGCDWNSYKNGVQIVILGFNKSTPGKPFKILKRVSIFGADTGSNVQIVGVRAIKQLYQDFKCDFVYVDRGHGGMQCEELQEYFFKIGKPNVFKAVDFGANYPYFDPFTGETIQKRSKVMMVTMLQQRFELREIIISKNEEKNAQELLEQLNYYNISKFDAKDQPVFDASQKGDHILDGLLLANFAFMENYGEVFNHKIGYTAHVIKKEVDVSPELGYIEKKQEAPKYEAPISMWELSTSSNVSQKPAEPVLLSNGSAAVIASKKRRRLNFDIF